MKRWLLLLFFGVAGLAAFYVPGLVSQIYIGNGFLAKQMCSCMLVGERSFESCRPDMMPAMDRIEAELLPDGQGVRAWIPGVGERVARLEAPFGCTLEP